jgi:phage major head subunit gpT-like protein
MIINKVSMDAVFTNFRADYEAGALAAKPMKDRIAMPVTSAAKEETYGWLGNNNRLREWIGSKVVNNLVATGFTIKNRTFENTVSVPREDIEDDRIGIYSGAFKMLGQDAALHPDELVFELIRNGTTQRCYDGQYFFDTDHPADPENPSAGSIANADMTGSAPGWVLLDTTKVVKPFIFQKRKDYTFIRKDQDGDDNVFFMNEYIYGVEARVNAGYGLWQLAYASDKTLDATAFAAARAAMMNLKAPTGKPLGIKPDLLLVAPDFEDDALKLLNLDTSHYKGAMELVVCPWMA